MQLQSASLILAASASSHSPRNSNNYDYFYYSLFFVSKPLENRTHAEPPGTKDESPHAFGETPFFSMYTLNADSSTLSMSRGS
jgi:hypothetical protein